MNVKITIFEFRCISFQSSLNRNINEFYWFDCIFVWIKDLLRDYDDDDDDGWWYRILDEWREENDGYGKRKTTLYNNIEEKDNPN